MFRTPHTPENLDHHCPRCDNELSVARVDEGRGYALALTCAELYCGYVLSLSAGEMQDIMTLGAFDAEPDRGARAAG